MSPDSKLQIVPFEARFQPAFFALNEAWISQYFTMEQPDYNALNNPQGYILEKGGAILIALYDGKPVGTCALIKMDHPTYQFELAKMAVSPDAQGKGIGFALGVATLEEAKRLGAKAVYLESNSKLDAALRLYQKLGFQDIQGYDSPYDRCDVQMAFFL